MNADWQQWLLVLLCGAGTFLLRYAPIWLARRRTPRAGQQVMDEASTTGVRRLFRGIGAAAISSLLLVSLWSAAASQPRLPPALLCTGAALLAVFAVKRLWGGLAAPALLGALVYGLGMQLLS